MGRNNKSKPALQSCPFCGSVAIVLNAADSGHDREDSLFWAQCEDCGASSSVKVSEDRAAEEWNRRAPASSEAIQAFVKGFSKVSPAQNKRSIRYERA